MIFRNFQSLRSTYAFMNQNEDHALSDKALRQALLRGLDKETYCNTLLEGGATAGKAPVPPTLDFGFDDLKDENAYDPDGAKKILEEAGYKDVDGDGFVETRTEIRLFLISLFTQAVQSLVYTHRQHRPA